MDRPEISLRMSIGREPHSARHPKSCRVQMGTIFQIIQILRHEENRLSHFGVWMQRLLLHVMQQLAMLPLEAAAINPSKIEWDLTNGPLSKLLEPMDTQV